MTPWILSSRTIAWAIQFKSVSWSSSTTKHGDQFGPQLFYRIGQVFKSSQATTKRQNLLELKTSRTFCLNLWSHKKLCPAPLPLWRFQAAVQLFQPWIQFLGPQSFVRFGELSTFIGPLEIHKLKWISSATRECHSLEAAILGLVQTLPSASMRAKLRPKHLARPDLVADAVSSRLQMCVETVSKLWINSWINSGHI